MKNNRFLVLMACLVLFLIPAVPVFAGKVITVAVNAGRPPMEMKDSKGRMTGFEIDLLKAVAKEAGFQVKIRDVPWIRIFKDLEAGKHDAVMASVIITDQKKEKFDFSIPYYTSEMVLVVRKDGASGPFEGKEVAVFRLSAGADMFRKAHLCKITFYTLDETDQAFKDLVKGNLAGILCDSHLAWGYINSKDTYKNKLMLADSTVAATENLPKEECGILVKKGDAATLDLINKGLQSVMEKGTDKELREKWMKSLMK
jgi:polar amino acid transport system substrate-binding protein